MLTGCAYVAGHWLEAYRPRRSKIDGITSAIADMTLPVFIGPNRCELIYNHEKQPLLELSLRVCLPVKELLSTLSPRKLRQVKCNARPPKPQQGTQNVRTLASPQKGSRRYGKAICLKVAVRQTGDLRLIPGSSSCSHTGNLTQWWMGNGKANGHQATPR